MLLYSAGERAFAAATCTAAAVAVLTVAPAIAGVSLEQPKLKKVCCASLWRRDLENAHNFVDRSVA
jgi:hypothetical protein